MAHAHAEIAKPLKYVRYSPDIPPQVVLGGAAATGLLTALVMGRGKGIIRKSIYVVRQPTLLVGATMLCVYPQQFAQQIGLRTHK